MAHVEPGTLRLSVRRIRGADYLTLDFQSGNAWTPLTAVPIAQEDE
jgi:hypothetical protein